MGINANIKGLEKKLSILIIKDKHNWVKVYLLLKEVEEKELWKDNYHSFTSWLKSFCLENKINETILWNRRRAGKVYEEYLSNNINNPHTKSLEEISVPMESLVLIDKIVKSNLTSENSDLVETKNGLIEKALNGELNREDLRQAYQICKQSKEKELEKDKSKSNTSNSKIVGKEKNTISALDIITILNNPIWIQELEVRDKQIKFYRHFTEKEKYKIYTEFPVYTGSSQFSRRIDILIVENLTSKYLMDLTFHGVEIKVDKNDLLNDCKYTEYADFVDFMWLAIPPNLIDTALKTKFPECGVIVVQNDKAQIIERATHLNPLRKDKAMNTLLLKVI